MITTGALFYVLDEHIARERDIALTHAEPGSAQAVGSIHRFRALSELRQAFEAEIQAAKNKDIDG